MDPRREQRTLSEGAHIVVGTPGRLCDHLRRRSLDVSILKAVVLDEADEMLDLGFRDDLEFILKNTPDTRRTLLFSATLPRGIVALAKQYQKNAFRIEVAGGEGGHADIEYRAIKVAAHDIEHATVNVLRYFESPSTIVFCNTRDAVRHLQAALQERGFSVVALSGELTQSERTRALQALRDGHARVCVATDVAARGIDLPNLDLVIHADLPSDPEVMQHRSGRTGRAGRKGVSILLVPPVRRRRAELMFDNAGIDAIWGMAPQAEEIRKLDQQRLLKADLFTEASTDDDLALARALLAERSPEDIAAALARIYRSRLPSPEDIADPGHGRDRPRDNRGERRLGSHTTGNASDGGLQSRNKKPGFRHSMAEGSVWFRASVGRQKNAEARWLLPMICRRGGIDKDDIGVIRIYDAHTEFEISAQAADQFAQKLKGPDKDNNIRIERLLTSEKGEAPSERQVDKAGAAGKVRESGTRQEDNNRYQSGPKNRSEQSSEAKLNKKPGFEPQRQKKHKPAFAGQARREGAPPFANIKFGKKPKKTTYRG
jgi:ATP-dependent RNA helicase DeaD